MEVKQEVKKEVKPASWLGVKHFVLDNTNLAAQTIVHEHSEFSATAIAPWC